MAKSKIVDNKTTQSLSDGGVTTGGGNAPGSGGKYFTNPASLPTTATLGEVRAVGSVSSEELDLYFAKTVPGDISYSGVPIDEATFNWDNPDASTHQMADTVNTDIFFTQATSVEWEQSGTIDNPDAVTGYSLELYGLKIESDPSFTGTLDGKLFVGDNWNVQINGDSEWSWWLNGVEYLSIVDLATAANAVFDVINTGGTLGGIEEAPEDGKTYGRKDAAWVEVQTSTSTGGGGTGVVGSGNILSVDIDFTSAATIDLVELGANTQIIRTILDVTTASDAATTVKIGDTTNGIESAMAAIDNDPETLATYISENIVYNNTANNIIQAIVATPGTVGEATCFIHLREVV